MKLTWQDLTSAGSVGVRRHISALANKQTPKDGAEDGSEPVAFEHDFLAATAEFAVARAFNMFWDPNVGRNANRDVGGCIDVRARRANGSGLDLVIKPKDVEKTPDVPFVLVHCRIPHFTLAGWLYPREIHDKERQAVWNDQRGIWFVTPKKIHEIETLSDVLPDLWLAAAKRGVAPKDED